MKKILFVATVESHILRFHIPYLKILYDMGLEVHVACDGEKKIPYCHVKHNIPFERFPLKPSNVKSFFMLKNIINNNKYSLIHCHTPIGGAIGRLSAFFADDCYAKVLYTAHGFHFCKRGPIGDWLLFFPIEKLLAPLTHCLITINEEDYALAKKHFKAKAIEKIYGIGVDLNKFSKQLLLDEEEQLMKSLGLDKSHFILLYAADLSGRKNQGFIIKCLTVLSRKIPGIKVLFAGPDTYKGKYQKDAEKLNVSKHIMFLGERNDIDKLLNIADVSITSSKREGLAVNIIEAFGAGKCVVASDVRGNRDLISHKKNGYLYSLKSKDEFIQIITDIYENPEKAKSMGSEAYKNSGKYSVNNIKIELCKIYEKYL